MTAAASGPTAARRPFTVAATSTSGAARSASRRTSLMISTSRSAEEGRSRTSLAIRVRTKLSTGPGSSGNSSRGGRGRSAACMWTTSRAVRASKGGWPTSMW